MEFRYRYVKYGTAFEPAAGSRQAPPAGATPAELDNDSRRLFENELVVDVGGVCWGYQGVTLPVLDHHFQRSEGQFPSAAAAVLHHAGRIHERFKTVVGPVWLVTHHAPDFDAYSAMYLARGILQGCQSGAPWTIPSAGWDQWGIEPGAWRQNGSALIDWFRPPAAKMPDDRRWAVLLAAFASCVDNCRPTACPKNRTLDAVLYAALVRGRDYASSGASEFFDAVRERLQSPTRPNPFFDSILEGCDVFYPELALLDREITAYEQDLRRARRTVVYIQKADQPFPQWYGEIIKQPLLDASQELSGLHQRPAGEELVALDGIFLRDPQCLLFKNWVRQDREHSSLGHGFTFTAIAYSGERAGAARNTTNYYFALDPERAIPDGLHLYNVWAALEAAELRALHTSPDLAPLRDQLLGKAGGPPAVCRPGFEARAGGLGPLANDPWFDGNNYNCTIVPTPNRGTVLGSPGSADDLSDDPAAQIVADAVESPALASPILALDLSLQNERQTRHAFNSVADAHAALHPVPSGSFRFCRVTLAEGIDPSKGQTGQQIGRLLWGLLEPHRGGVPTDFLSRHLLLAADGVQVWSRAGIVTAVKRSAEAQASVLETQMRELVELAGKVGNLAAQTPRGDRELQALVEEGESLARRIALWRQHLSYSEGRLLRRFFDATNLSQILSSINDINSSRAVTLVGRRLDANVGFLASVQNSAEWLEVFIVSFYSLEMAHILAGVLDFKGHFHGIAVPIVAALCAATLLLGMQPWASHSVDADPQHTQHQSSHRLIRSLLIVLLIMATFVGAGLYHRDHTTQNSGSPATKTSEPGHGH